jgi:alpha-beta hydrolase superfamily lysophospholipase
MKPTALLLPWLFKRWLLLTIIVMLLLLVGAFLSLRQPDLELWHHEAPQGEFRAKDYKGDYSLTQYRELEDRLFAQLDRYGLDLDATPQYSRFIRYIQDGQNTPAKFPQNWNRTYELVPEKIRGGVLLIHGLSDSPYSLRHIGEIFLRNGFYVLSVRLPGHGTAPAGLLGVSWEDWYAIVTMGAGHVVARTGKKGPYSADVLLNPQGTLPDKLILLSPAVGITPFARVSNWHKAFSWIPAFEKYKWVDVKTEIEPFKYTSFPKNAGAQMWNLSLAVQEDIDKLAKENHMTRFPPVLTFQSVVDATTRAADVVQKLYDKMSDNGSELVAFDLNRSVYLRGLFAVDPEEALAGLQGSGTLSYRLTIITNKDGTGEVVARSTAPFSTKADEVPTGFHWPAGVYSMSHVAIPFPPDDLVYGTEPTDPSGGPVRFGRLFAKGEKKVLHISADDLIRMRYNPFFDYMAEKIQGWIDGDSGL